MPDYAGSGMNRASRLCGMARPEGSVSHFDVSRASFYDLARDGIGSIFELKGVKGLEHERLRVFCTPDVELAPKNVSRKVPPGEMPTED